MSSRVMRDITSAETVATIGLSNQAINTGTEIGGRRMDFSGAALSKDLLVPAFNIVGKSRIVLSRDLGFVDSLAQIQSVKERYIRRTAANHRPWRVIGFCFRSEHRHPRNFPLRGNQGLEASGCLLRAWSHPHFMRLTSAHSPRCRSW
jgi:hypothetical protein